MSNRVNKLVNASEFSMRQDDKYRMFLAKGDGEEEYHLYRVQITRTRQSKATFSSAILEYTENLERFVLAENEYGAISQATCTYRMDGDLVITEESYVVERVPFRIRGWSSNEF